jgi:hypothetical protein
MDLKAIGAFDLLAESFFLPDKLCTSMQLTIEDFPT